MNGKIIAYHITITGGPDDTLTSRIQIKLTGDSDKTLAWIRFYDPGTFCEPDYIENDIIIMHLPVAMFQSVYDVLLNEMPIYIHFTKNRGLLTTSQEPVGEGEGKLSPPEDQRKREEATRKLAEELRIQQKRDSEAVEGHLWEAHRLQRERQHRYYEEERRAREESERRYQEEQSNREALERRFQKKNYAVVKVFFATDRNFTPSSYPNEKFGSSRSEISYGTCDVSIPRDHRMGELEAPSIWKLEFRETPTKHVVLLDVSVIKKDKFFSDLSDRVRSSTNADAFIFIHGYNVTFEDAARRTAQMSYDLGFDGAPVFYSWPSKGSVTGYTIDESNIEWAQSNLKGFLVDFLDRSKADNIFLIAHSMGNRALMRAYAGLITENPEAKQRFREIILTAPDIDAEVFKRDIAPVMTGAGQAVTLYASSKDVALAASKKFHGYPRAGDSGEGLVLLQGIETIDATNVDTSFLGHSYFATARSVLSDIFNLIRNGQRADQRFGLRRVEIEGIHYWVFKQ